MSHILRGAIVLAVLSQGVPARADPPGGADPAAVTATAPPSLRETDPTVYAALMEAADTDTAARVAAVGALELVVWLAQSPDAGRLLLDPLRINGAALIALVLADPGAALGHAARSLGAEMAEGAIISVAAAVAVDAVFRLPGFAQVDPAWQDAMRPVLHVAIMEIIGVLRAGTGDPGALVGPLVDRVADIYRIASEARRTARAQDEALTAMAMAIESAAVLLTGARSAIRGDRARNGARRDSRHARHVRRRRCGGTGRDRQSDLCGPRCAGTR